MNYMVLFRLQFHIHGLDSWGSTQQTHGALFHEDPIVIFKYILHDNAPDSTLHDQSEDTAPHARSATTTNVKVLSLTNPLIIAFSVWVVPWDPAFEAAWKEIRRVNFTTGTTFTSIFLTQHSVSAFYSPCVQTGPYFEPGSKLACPSQCVSQGGVHFIVFSDNLADMMYDLTQPTVWRDYNSTI